MIEMPIGPGKIDLWMEERHREVLAMRYFERLSAEETANVLGLTVSGVAKRQIRALGRLQREIPRTEDVPTPT